MIKKVSIIFLFLLLVSPYLLKIVGADEINEWEFIPSSLNYFSNNNIEVNYNDGCYNLEIKDYIRVKPSTTYTINTIDGKTFFDSNMYFDVYDYSLLKIQDDIDNNQTNYGFTFTIPSDGKFISGSIPLYEFEESDDLSLEDIFVLYEGTETQYDVISNNSTYELGELNYTSAGNQNVGEYYTDVDNPSTTATISKYLKAYDNVDGDVTNKITINTNEYEQNMDRVGVHKIVYKVADTSGNESSFQVNVHVVDNKSPIITGTKKYYISPLEQKSISDIKSALTITDNYDGIIDNENLEVVSDNYTNNSEAIGTYEIKMKISDTSDNESFVNVTMVVKDKTAPVITGDSNITKSVEEQLSLEDIQNSLSVIDDVDGDVSGRLTVISDAYTGNESKLGTYTIVFKATDKSMNGATYSVVVEVIDDLPPVFYIADIVINLNINQNILSEQKIKEALFVLGKIKENSKVELNDDFQLLSTSEVGENIYEVSIDGVDYDLKVNVIENMYDEVKEKNDLNFFERIIEFFQNSFKSFINTIKDVF